MASFGERFVGAMTLNVKTFEEVEADTTAMGQAVTVVLISALANGIGNIFRHGFTAMIYGTVAALVGYAVWAALVWVIGTKVMPEPTTKADFPETFRVVGFAAAPGIANVLQIIPFLGWLIGFAVGIWMLVAMVVAVRQVLDYSNTGKAIVVCVIGFIGYWIALALVMIPMMGMAFLAR
jgi:hypothetical protein